MTDNNCNTPSWEHDEFVHGWWISPGRFLATVLEHGERVEQLLVDGRFRDESGDATHGQVLVRGGRR